MYNLGSENLGSICINGDNTTVYYSEILAKNPLAGAAEFGAKIKAVNNFTEY
jgi:hypothetical protein